MTTMPGPITSRYLDALGAYLQKQEALAEHHRIWNELRKDSDALTVPLEIAREALWQSGDPSDRPDEQESDLIDRWLDRLEAAHNQVRAVLTAAGKTNTLRQE